ncbi:MAG TPA: CoA-binding protein [Candidatus Eremiobacteraceae bacterium]|nr:CoA-binding protein [Candidatus Eremiobacteraceae bacterium]
MILTTAGQRRALFDSSPLVAVVGASANPLRASYFVYKYLRAHGVRAFGVNPAYSEIDGTACYPTLAAFAAAQGRPDIVDVFRNPAETPGVVRDAIAAGTKAVWFQYGVINEEAIRMADEAGLLVVVDRCMKVEHARFHGGLSIAGMNSGLITSKRRA